MQAFEGNFMEIGELEHVLILFKGLHVLKSRPRTQEKEVHLLPQVTAHLTVSQVCEQPSHEPPRQSNREETLPQGEKRSGGPSPM